MTRPSKSEGADGEASQWLALNIEGKALSILEAAGAHAQAHHLGRPFLTAYQIAIAFARRYPRATQELGLPIGGLGSGQRNSLAQYLARGLSRSIKAGRLPHVEGGFLSNDNLFDISFDVDGKIVRSSLKVCCIWSRRGKWAQVQRTSEVRCT